MNPNSRRHSFTVPSGGPFFLPIEVAASSASPWSGVASEEDIPKLAKLKKINKRNRRRKSTNDGIVGPNSPAIQNDARSPPGFEGQGAGSVRLLYQSCSDLSNGDGRRKKRTRRKLSFAGFLPFLFSDKSRAAGGRETKRNGLSPDSRRGVGMTHKHSFSSSSSNDSDNGGRRETVNNEGTCDAGYRGKSSYHRQLATKRHSVTFGCLHELADMDHVESLMSVLEKADWLSSQEQLTNQTSGESANHGACRNNEQMSHHPSTCSEHSDNVPVILCTECDQRAPTGCQDSKTSLNTDNQDEDGSSSRVRHSSSRSLPESSMPEAVDPDASNDDKVTDPDENEGDSGQNLKLRRKKACKVVKHAHDPDTTVRGHARSLSCHDMSNLDRSKQSRACDEATDAAHRLDHGDSGIVISAGHYENRSAGRPSLADARRRMCSIDSAPVDADQAPGRPYVYSERQKMPILDGPSPTRSEFSSSPANESAFAAHGSGETIFDHMEPIDTSQLVVAYRIGRDGGGPIIMKAKTDTAHDRPYPFTRKHSMPAIYALKSVSQKLNLGNVECFKIHFDIIEELTKETDVELVPAIRGVTLREAVNSYLLKRGLTFDMVDFFIAASQSPLQVDTADCYFLAGADLHVKAKQTVDTSYNRSASTISNRSAVKTMYLKRDQSVRHAASVSSFPCHGSGVAHVTQTTSMSSSSAHRWSSLRPRNSIPNVVKSEPHPLAQLLPAQFQGSVDPGWDEGKNSRTESSIPEAVSPHGTLKSNQALKGITKIFNVSKKSDLLNEILQSYTLNGWPPMQELLQLGQKKFDSAIFSLENSWTDLVKEPQNCNRYQQEAIWELLKTEVAYIKDLQLVINLFMACLYNLQSHELLNDIETEKIFSNIADLHQYNCLFYETHMYKIVTTARETGQPLDPTPLIDGFTEFRSFFEAYSRFCIDYMGCQQYLVRMKEENELFKMFLSWAENQRECNRLSLRDYIGKPFQRLTKYKLLLERIWREPRSERVQAMISKVDQFICQVNATVTQLEIMRRIESYDAVDFPNNDHIAKIVGPYSRLDLTKPIPGTNRTRFLIEEGTLRMNSRTDVICFLFTDMLLITKAASKKADIGSKVRVKVYKPPMRLDKVCLSALNDGGFVLIYLNEYNLATTAYTFHGEQSKMWFDKLSRAQREYEKLRNDIMDQSEAKMLNWANGFEYEDEYAYINARSVAMEMSLDQAGVHRHVSTSSADSSVVSQAARSEGKRLYSMPGSELDKMRVRSAVNLHDPNHDWSPRNSPPVTPLVNQLPPNSAISSHTYQDQSLTHVDPGIDSTPYLTKSIPVGREYYRPPQHVPEEPNLRLSSQVSHDDLKKLKQRRDRRYFTADMIQDLHHGKDASIQKRLSWHSGAKDTDYECKQRMVKNKTISSDSVRSVYSSSGISSVGSLHQNQDQEISEEGDIEWAERSSEDSSSVTSDMTTKTHLTGSKTEPLLREAGTGSEAESLRCAVKSRDSDTQTPTNLTTHSKVSKSMPDISQLTLSDGSGVAGRRAALLDFREGQRRKLSDNYSKRLKLQLLNSTLEATDV